MSVRRMPPLGMLAVLLAVLLVVPALVAPPGAEAAPWRPARPLTASSTQYTAEPDVATNARGDSVGVMIADRTIGGVSTTVVLVTRRPAGGQWSTPVIASANGAGLPSSTARVGIAADGRALVAWTYSNGTNTQVRSRLVPVRGALGPIRDVTPVAAGQNASDLDLDVNPAGRVGIVWDQGGGTARGAVGTVAGVGPALTLTPAAGTGIFVPGVAVDARGNAQFVWERDLADRYLVESCRWRAGVASCDPVVTHAGDGADQRAEYPDVDVNAAGEAIICFSFRSSASSSESSIRYAVREAGGGWTGTGDVAPGTRTANFRCSVALRPDGSAAVGYADTAGNYFVATRDGGGFGRREQVNGPGVAFYTASLAVGARGHVAVVYSLTGVTYGATLAPGSRDLSRVERLVVDTGPSAGSSAAASVDDQGNVHVLATHGHCDNVGCGNVLYRAWTAAHDAGAPAVAGISRPASGRRNQVVTIRALGVTDRVSTVKVTWRFSDGTSASGTTVRKKLRRAGRLGITVTVTDAAGRRATRTSSLTVRP